jgi:hypothetical protein
MSQGSEYVNAVYFRGHGDKTISQLMREAADYLESNSGLGIWDIVINFDDDYIVIYHTL